MSKYKVEPTSGNGHAADTQFEADDAHPAPHGGDEFATKLTVIGAVVVGAAILEAALIPGIIIGGIAAAFAPSYLPKLGQSLRPMFHSTMREAYKIGRKVRTAAGEVQEHMSDIAAEVKAEDSIKANEETPHAVGITKYGGAVLDGAGKKS